MHDLLIVFTRYPEPGKTKTRLIPSLGAEGAADLHRQMTALTMSSARQIAHAQRLSVEVRYEGGNAELVTKWLGNRHSLVPQGPGNLGDRMHRAFADSKESGTDRTVIIGTDCPGLTSEILHLAFESLNDKDIVIGPAVDGGYYLIGLRNPIPEIFQGIDWGTGSVFDDTMSIVRRVGLSAAILPTLRDIDRPEDLDVWKKLQPPGPDKMITVIIPALNEADNIAETLMSVDAEYNVEVMVVDGGSTDATAAIARGHGATVINSAPGRARQMNAGAASAKGDILLFLHSDTRLPKGFCTMVIHALEQPGVAAGAFEFKTNADLPSLRIIERLVNWRSRRGQMPYGDQGIFLNAGLFNSIGGFTDLPIMEDVDLIKRVRGRGRIHTVAAPAVTSARRWLTLGVARTTIINQLVIIAYKLGVNPHCIARWYRTSDAAVKKTLS